MPAAKSFIWNGFKSDLVHLLPRNVCIDFDVTYFLVVSIRDKAKDIFVIRMYFPL